jgi:hypothetical protein
MQDRVVESRDDFLGDDDGDSEEAAARQQGRE